MNRVKFLRNETYDFLTSFDDDLVTKVFGLLEILDELGVHLGPPKLKKITKEIYELRIIGKVSIRILCSFLNSKIYILHAFIKKSQKIPRKELEKAIHRLTYLH
ncbi:MAG: type II toxin-antitoxin system RelE/ParE family toxin [Candidatus Nomurabacteria bacterium]|nr:type II toxin-antitoxin system RelE/ParE family toxin [Candidatus Nomurabacteria bacterium]